MAIRDKLRKKFGSKKNGSGESIPGSNSPLRTDIEYYKPHEIPKSKYRGKVDKAHQERLEAYSLGDAFSTLRRKSSQALSGTFSPGGTHAQSRRASWVSRAKSTFSTTSEDGDKDGGAMRRKSVASAGAPKEDTVDENDEEDTDVANTGTSTATTANDPFQSNSPPNLPKIRLEKTITAARPSSPNSSPFTVEELEQAMTRATLRPRRGTVIAPALQPEAIAA